MIRKRGTEALLNCFEQEGLVECYMDSSTYCVHLEPYSEQKALQFKKNIIELLVMAYTWFSDKFSSFLYIFRLR